MINSVMKQEGEEMKNEKPEAVNEHAGIGMNGHILIRDKETGEELVNKRNAIHYGNMANLVANALNNQAQSYIHFMAFGNGGTSVDTAGKVVYKSPRVSESFEASADLYSRSYSKVISAAASDPSTDKIEVIAGSSFTDLKITCTLGFAEPNDQDLFDSSTDNDGSYVFDELALYSYPTDLTTGITTSKMLTHVVFHPVQKSQNRIIEIIYTVRIQLS